MITRKLALLLLISTQAYAGAPSKTEGRFQIVENGKFLLDTESGSVWQAVCVSPDESCNSGGGLIAWTALLVEKKSISSEEFFQKIYKMSGNSNAAKGH